MFLAKFFNKSRKDNSESSIKTLLQNADLIPSPDEGILESKPLSVQQRHPSRDLVNIISRIDHKKEKPVIIALMQSIVSNQIPQLEQNDSLPKIKTLPSYIEESISDNEDEEILEETLRNFLLQIANSNNIQIDENCNDIELLANFVVEKLQIKKNYFIENLPAYKIDNISVNEMVQILTKSTESIESFPAENILKLNENLLNDRVKIQESLKPLLSELQKLLFKQYICNFIKTLHTSINDATSDLLKFDYAQLLPNLLKIKSSIELLIKLNIEDIYSVIEDKLTGFIDCVKIQVSQKLHVTLDNLNFGLTTGNNFNSAKEKEFFKSQVNCLNAAQDILTLFLYKENSYGKEIYWTAKIMAALIILHFRLLFFSPKSDLNRLDLPSDISVHHIINALQTHTAFIKSCQIMNEEVLVTQLTQLAASEYAEYMQSLYKQISELKTSENITAKCIEKRLSELITEFLNGLDKFTQLKIPDIVNYLLEPHWFSILHSHDLSHLKTFYSLHEPSILVRYTISKSSNNKYMLTPDNTVTFSELLHQLIQAIHFFQLRISNLPTHYSQLYAYHVFLPIFQTLYSDFKALWNRINSLFESMEDTGFLIDSIHITYSFLNGSKFAQRNPHLAKHIEDWQKLCDDSTKTFANVILKSIKPDLQSLHWITAHKLLENCIPKLEEAASVIKGDAPLAVFLNYLAEIILNEILQYLHIRLNVIYEKQRSSLIENYYLILNFWENLPSFLPTPTVKTQLQQLKDIKHLLLLPEEVCKPTLSQLTKLLKLQKNLNGNESELNLDNSIFRSVQLLKHAESLIKSTQQYLTETKSTDSINEHDISHDIIDLQIDKCLKQELKVTSLDAKQTCRILSKRFELFFSDVEL